MFKYMYENVQNIYICIILLATNIVIDLCKIKVKYINQNSEY